MGVKVSSPPPRVVVVGAGLGGVTMAVKLTKAGFHDFVVLEAEEGAGGTWRVNDYPGCEVDVDSAIYSLPYRDHVFTRTHAKQPELLDYIEETLDIYHVRERFRFGVRVEEIRWDDQTCTYTVRTADGERLECDVVVSAVGMLSDPKPPPWPGAATFQGRMFHTQKWPKDVDLSGRRVAVVGVGASAAQIVPSIADEVKQLYVFQREPGWVLPKHDRDFSEAELRELSKRSKRLGRKLKLMAKNEWAYLYHPVFQVNSKRNLAGRDRALAYLDEVFADRPDLKAALTPQYPFSGKRRILTDVFYPTLKRTNVELVPHEVSGVTATGIVDSTGYEREVDVIITAIGYKASDYLSSLRVYGRGGRDLHEKWRDGAFAFLGTTVPEFPNLYLLYGPNTNGAAPITYVHERQAAYVVANLKRMLRTGVKSIEVKSSWTDRYNKVLQRRLSRTAWAQGNNYFKGPKGQIVTQWRDGLVVFSLLLKLLRRPASIER
ncbi:NAD(P)/FAD-dependent oxidoreductase [Parafrankia sp. EUN1f]|uniref:flavin-containing monooxygenase n=1 Tax=Parafrankia sp. EUN1f TaxID=102897 RepID=UPI0001C473ED|nr:NAD(P)/FAD-dependent oxidoreductase [Parafrankia sp. EUN1f]EFC86772.1 alpha/beta hydrolase domain-containing protein [Parafrankia sp. EUN1f]